MKILITSLLLVLLSACSKEPQSTVSTTNSEIKVDVLFEKDGYTLHRFYDGQFVYYVTPTGSTMKQESCGKNCKKLQITETK